MQTIQFINTTPTALVNLIDESVKKQLEELKKSFKPKNPTIYLTRKEVASMFQVDLSTVHNWTKRGKLKSYGISGRVYFKRFEVENSLIELKK